MLTLVVPDFLLVSSTLAAILVAGVLVGLGLPHLAAWGGLGGLPPSTSNEGAKAADPGPRRCRPEDAPADHAVEGPGSRRLERRATQEEQLLQRLVADLSLRQLKAVLKRPSMEDAAHNASQDELCSSFSSPLQSPPRSPRNASDMDVAEVVSATRAGHASRKRRTPKQVLLDLQRGNGRFWTGRSQRPELNAMERRALIIAQAPSVCVLGCADSRVPVEIIFDQGLGDIFVVRVAGNVLDSASHGSIEYAVHHLDVKVVMVLGHEGCGAVRGAIGMAPADIDREPPHLQQLLHNVRDHLPMHRLMDITDARARDREAVVCNCTFQMRQLLETDIVAKRVAAGTLIVCGAFYEITSGIVDFFSLNKDGLLCDVDEEPPHHPTLHLSPKKKARGTPPAVRLAKPNTSPSFEPSPGSVSYSPLLPLSPLVVLDGTPGFGPAIAPRPASPLDPTATGRTTPLTFLAAAGRLADQSEPKPTAALRA